MKISGERGRRYANRICQGKGELLSRTSPHRTSSGGHSLSEFPCISHAPAKLATEPLRAGAAPVGR